MPTCEEDDQSARREECMMHEATKRWEMAYHLFANDMHDIYLRFVMERDRLRLQTKKERMVTPQDLCSGSMVTPQDVMQQQRPGDLQS